MATEDLLEAPTPEEAEGTLAETFNPRVLLAGGEVTARVQSDVDDGDPPHPFEYDLVKHALRCDAARACQPTIAIILSKSG